MRDTGGGFNWDKLMARIDGGHVIPVLGRGLYRVNTPDEGDTAFYPYLARKLAKTLNSPESEEKDLTFAKTAFLYLQEHPHEYLDINRFLMDTLAAVRPVKECPLEKLARIKPFSFFINTTYDGLMESALKSARTFPTRVLNHTYREKQTRITEPDLFHRLQASQLSLLFNIFGGAARNVMPAYTEKDILETVVAFQRDMEMEAHNPLFQELEKKSMLFLGCGYDDWLFRFFIRTIANDEFRPVGDGLKKKFVGDDFNSFHSGGLRTFLNAYDSETYYSGDGVQFTDILTAKLAEKHPYHIIPEDEFPCTAFISFHGADRVEAERLAAHLREDGVSVWLDERELQPGDAVDGTIIKAIEKCPAFVPLVSQAAKQIRRGEETALKFHVREWEIAQTGRVTGRNPRIISPVFLDDTRWVYEHFSNDLHVPVPGGHRRGDYEKLKNTLLRIQEEPRDIIRG